MESQPQNPDTGIILKISPMLMLVVKGLARLHVCAAGFPSLLLSTMR